VSDLTFRKFQSKAAFSIGMPALIEQTTLTGQRRAAARRTVARRPRGQLAHAVATRGLGIVLLCVAIAALAVPLIAAAALLGAVSGGSAVLLVVALWVALPLLAVGGVAVCSQLDDRA
jgi:hypothetical protein